MATEGCWVAPGPQGCFQPIPLFLVPGGSCLRAFLEVTVSIIRGRLSPSVLPWSSPVLPSTATLQPYSWLPRRRTLVPDRRCSEETLTVPQMAVDPREMGISSGVSGHLSSNISSDPHTEGPHSDRSTLNGAAP